MIQINKRGLAAVATAFVVAGAVLAGVSALGKVNLGRMLERDAVATAGLLARAVERSGATNLADAVAAGAGGLLGQALALAAIDKTVLISQDGRVTPLGASGQAAEEEFRSAIAAKGAGARPFGLMSGAYTTDVISWFPSRPYHSWVLFPAGRGSTRLAIRIDQTRTARELSASFSRQVLFSGGVAMITFAAFMSGFSYRQRRLASENAAIRYLALHDELTGLPNRKQFEEFMAGALVAAERDGHKSALFVLDLDGFKAVNDTLGHPVGDGLLRAAARRLKSSLRNGDLLARLSGDEFAIVVPKVTDENILAPLAERVLQLVGNPFRVDGHHVQIGCSIGLAVAPDNGFETATVMRNADFALYRAKSEGRRTWRFFDPKMAEDLASRRMLQDGLRHALEHDQFQLVYQPQIELSTGNIRGYEAMLRWRLTDRGLVPASVFMAIAEETGLVVPIGEWVIRQVARDYAMIPSGRRVAINLSATQLKRDGVESFIAETLERHKIPPSRVEIEINETVLGRNEAVTFARLERIRDSGIGIVMDSFGVGTLSLGLLSRYAFDKVKVDRSFLMHDIEKSGAVLAAICSLGRSLGFRVSGQGVETIEHAELLRAAGCAEAQGYHFAPPMPLEQLLRSEYEGDSPRLAAIA